MYLKIQLPPPEFPLEGGAGGEREEVREHRGLDLYMEDKGANLILIAASWFQSDPFLGANYWFLAHILFTLIHQTSHSNNIYDVVYRVISNIMSTSDLHLLCP